MRGAARRGRGRSADDEPAGGLHGFSIAQISDVHVGPTIKCEYRQCNRRRSESPRRRCCRRDRRPGRRQRSAARRARRAAVAACARVTAPTSSRAITSTTRVRKRGRRSSADWDARADERARRAHAPRTPVVVAGVTDYSAHHFDPAASQRSRRRAAGRSGDRGREDPAGASAAHQQPRPPRGFDLQLSGHTHGGQFWPWNLFVRFQQPFTAGLHRLSDLWVYVSRGTGYWGRRSASAHRRRSRAFGSFLRRIRLGY